MLLRLIDVGATRKFQGKPRRMTSPTLTKTRASGGGFYLTKLKRRLLPKVAWMSDPKINTVKKTVINRIESWKKTGSNSL